MVKIMAVYDEDALYARRLAEYVNKMGISIKAICENTGLSKNVLYTSLGSGRDRELRADEFLSICIFLDKNPMDFFTDEKKEQDQ